MSQALIETLYEIVEDAREMGIVEEQIVFVFLMIAVKTHCESQKYTEKQCVDSLPLAEKMLMLMHDVCRDPNGNPKIRLI